jgi:hypothetical protein
MGPRIDLHDFSAITTLRIYHTFLCGIGDTLEYSHDTWKGLPPNVEILEVYYDEAGYIDLLENYDSTWRGGEWLFQLLNHKEEHLPKLSKLTIRTPENEPGSDDWSETREVFSWTLPRPLAMLAQSASVELTVLLGFDKRPEPKEYDALDLDQIMFQGNLPFRPISFPARDMPILQHRRSSSPSASPIQQNPTSGTCSIQ